MYFVYIIYSKLINRYYIGCSNDPRRRLKYHNLAKSGSKSAFTKRAKDWKLVWKKGFSSRKEALDYEREVKKQKSRKFIENLISGA